MRNSSFIAIGVVAAFLLLMGSAFTVNESQTAIVLNLGKVVRSGLEPGLHFKVPLVEEVRKFDRRILTLDDSPERYLTSEKKDVSVDFFVKWRISDVSTYYRAASGGNEDAARARLQPIIKNVLRDQINQLSLQEVVSGTRVDLGQKLVSLTKDGADTLGVEIVDIRIKRINLPDDSTILSSVFERMSAERTRVANQLRAEGTELSDEIRSNAERQQVVIVAEAERDAQILRGEGDARAADIYAQAYNRDAEFYSFYRSLEAYRASLLDGKTTLVLDPDSEFLQYFDKGRR